MNQLSLLLTRAFLPLLLPRERDERGDVPGWVLVTVMSAGLVGILYKLAGRELASMFSAALAKVNE